MDKQQKAEPVTPGRNINNPSRGDTNVTNSQLGMETPKGRIDDTVGGKRKAENEKPDTWERLKQLKQSPGFNQSMGDSDLDVAHDQSLGLDGMEEDEDEGCCNDECEAEKQKLWDQIEILKSKIDWMVNRQMLLEDFVQLDDTDSLFKTFTQVRDRLISLGACRDDSADSELKPGSEHLVNVLRRVCAEAMRTGSLPSDERILELEKQQTASEKDDMTAPKVTQEPPLAPEASRCNDTPTPLGSAPRRTTLSIVPRPPPPDDQWRCHLCGVDAKVSNIKLHMLLHAQVFYQCPVCKVLSIHEKNIRKCLRSNHFVVQDEIDQMKLLQLKKDGDKLTPINSVDVQADLDRLYQECGAVNVSGEVFKIAEVDFPCTRLKLANKEGTGLGPSTSTVPASTSNVNPTSAMSNLQYFSKDSVKMKHRFGGDSKQQSVSSSRNIPPLFDRQISGPTSFRRDSRQANFRTASSGYMNFSGPPSNFLKPFTRRGDRLDYAVQSQTHLGYDGYTPAPPTIKRHFGAGASKPAVVSAGHGFPTLPATTQQYPTPPQRQAQFVPPGYNVPYTYDAYEEEEEQEENYYEDEGAFTSESGSNCSWSTNTNPRSLMSLSARPSHQAVVSNPTYGLSGSHTGPTSVVAYSTTSGAARRRAKRLAAMGMAMEGNPS